MLLSIDPRYSVAVVVVCGGGVGTKSAGETARWAGTLAAPALSLSLCGAIARGAAALTVLPTGCRRQRARERATIFEPLGSSDVDTWLRICTATGYLFLCARRCSRSMLPVAPRYCCLDDFRPLADSRRTLARTTPLSVYCTTTASPLCARANYIHTHYKYYARYMCMYSMSSEREKENISSSGFAA